MFSMPGPWELILILVVVLLFFGGRRLPQLGSSLGEALRNFKSSLFGSSDSPDELSDNSKSPEKKG